MHMEKTKSNMYQMYVKYVKMYGSEPLENEIKRRTAMETGMGLLRCTHCYPQRISAKS